MVMLNFVVTDGDGRYVHGLQPQQVRILDEGVPQQITSFAEGRRTIQAGPGQAGTADSSVFVLFDTSNYMYEDFPYAMDSVAEFIRRLDPADAVAVYGFSRNLIRLCPLTRDRQAALRGLRHGVAGGGTALFNSLLLTLRDAAEVPGRKVVVVFSNGPDDASVLSPDDVRRVAEGTGGKVLFARTWPHQRKAFAAVRQEIANYYTAAFYPHAGDAAGYHKLEVQIVGHPERKLTVRARSGYRAAPAAQAGLSAGAAR
jgi:hypothetical protein